MLIWLVTLILNSLIYSPDGIKYDTEIQRYIEITKNLLQKLSKVVRDRKISLKMKQSVLNV